MEPTKRDPVPAAVPARPRRRHHWLGIVLAVAALAALFALAWHLTHRDAGGPGAGRGGHAGGPGGPGGGGRGGPPSTVGIATAVRSDMPVTLDALGTVTPVATVTVRPQVSGVLQKVLYTEGQTVKAGQVLAQIDPRPFQIALLQAQGQRERDEAQLDNARITLKRYQTLLSQDSIARQDVDTQAALVKQLEGTVTADRANEATAQLNLGYTRITAPVSGRAGLRPVDEGNLVSSGDSGGVAVITEIEPTDVAFSVPQDSVPQIQARLGTGAVLEVSALDRSRSNLLATGRFSTLDNQIDTQTGTVKAKARFANGDGRLFPNQFVNARLLVDTVKAAITVPVTAVRQGPDGDFVFVLNDDHTVSQRPVKRGISATDKVQVVSGLEAGEKVVTEGADRLRDGAKVVLPTDRPASGAGAASGAGHGHRHGGASGAAWDASGASGAAHGHHRGASGAAGGGDASGA